MKRVAFVTILVLALAACAGAQEVVKGITAKGVKLGFNISNYTNTGIGVFSTRAGFGFGGFVTYSLSPRFAVQPELMYMQKGTEYGFFGSLTWSADYLEVPILAKYSFPTKGKFKPSFFAGPALALLLSSNVEAEYQGETFLDISVKDGMKSADVGIVLGGGFAYQLRTFALTFDIRYTWGLVNFIDADKINNLASPDDPESYLLDEDPNSKNVNLSFLFGASF